MQPNLVEGDNLIVEKVSHRFGWLKRGDVIVFKLEEDNRQLIKRLIALEGDKVEIKDGKIYVNDEAADDSYLGEGVTTLPGSMAEYSSLVVPEGTIYALGDNRQHSKDSRMLGPIPISAVSGKAILRFYPFNKFGTF